MRISQPVPCGAPVRIDTSEILLLGEVCRCVPEEGAYTLGIQLSETLNVREDLPRLRDALPARSLPARFACGRENPCSERLARSFIMKRCKRDG